MDYDRSDSVASGTRRRAIDRPLVTAILMSVAIHAAVLAVFLYASTLEGPVLPRPSRVSGEPIVSVALLPAPSPPEASVSSQPSPTARSVARPLTPEPLKSQVYAERPPKPNMALASASVPQNPSPSASDPQTQATVGSAPATANHPIAIDPAAGIDYRQRLLLHIAGFRRRSALADGDATGTVRIRFAVRRDGTVSAVSIVTGSGIAELDDEAVATIWRAQPMPPIPTVLPDTLSITLPISFGIEGRNRG